MLAFVKSVCNVNFKVVLSTKSKNYILIGVFPKWSRTFTDFSEFREPDNH